MLKYPIMKLKEFLKNKNREQFAKIIHTTKNYVDQLCAEIRRPSPELALKIEKATGKEVTVLELLYPNEKAA